VIYTSIKAVESTLVMFKGKVFSVCIGLSTACGLIVGILSYDLTLSKGLNSITLGVDNTLSEFILKLGFMGMGQGVLLGIIAMSIINRLVKARS